MVGPSTATSGSTEMQWTSSVCGRSHCRPLLSHLQQDVERLLLQMLVETLLLLFLLLLFQCVLWSGTSAKHLRDEHVPNL